MARPTMHRLRGTISSAEFDDGHRVVIGCWRESPLGPMHDVMWAHPNGTRTLLAPTDDIAEYIMAIYRFDETRVGELVVHSDGRTTSADGFGWSIRLTGGRMRPVPIRRPRAFTALVEAPIARALMGVNAVGVSPTGVREWYQTRGWRWVVGGSATFDGVDMGAPRPFSAPVAVGFSEPPRRPSIVTVDVSVEWPGVDHTSGKHAAPSPARSVPLGPGRRSYGRPA